MRFSLTEDKRSLEIRTTDGKVVCLIEELTFGPGLGTKLCLESGVHMYLAPGKLEGV